MKRTIFILLILMVITLPALAVETETVPSILDKAKENNSRFVGVITKSGSKFIIGIDLTVEEVKDYKRTNDFYIVTVKII